MYNISIFNKNDRRCREYTERAGWCGLGMVDLHTKVFLHKILTHIKGFQEILAGWPTLLKGSGGNTAYT